MSRPSLRPDYTTPADLADHFGVSKRTLWEQVREIGAFAKLGKKVILFPEHVDQLTEAMKCPSSSTGAAKSGTIEAPSLGGDFAALQARLTEKPRSGSKPKLKQKPGAVISMGRGQG